MSNTTQNDECNGINLKAFHEDTLTNYYGIDPKTYNPIDTTNDTLSSRKCEKVHMLHNTSSRLGDCKELLNEVVDVLEARDTSTTRKQAAIKIIKKSISPTIDIASSVTRTAASIVSPIGGSKYTHNRLQRKKRDAAALNSKKSARLQMVEEYVKNKGLPQSASQSSQVEISGLF